MTTEPPLTQKSLEAFEASLDKKTRNLDVNAVLDGIVDIMNYLKSNPRILWILKEPNILEDEKAQKFNWREAMVDLAENDSDFKPFARTFSNIVYLTYGFLNKKLDQETPYIRDNSEILKVLKQIAIINVSKSPGGSKTSKRELKKKYETYKEILKQQLEAFQPNIIVCGGTYDIVSEELEQLYYPLESCEFKNPSNLNIRYSKSKRVLVYDAYHPNLRRCKRKIYLNDILDHYINFKS